MKRWMSLLLICTLSLSACGQSVTTESTAVDRTDAQVTEYNTEAKTEQSSYNAQTAETIMSEDVQGFGSLSDPKLLQYVEDNVYAGLVGEFCSEDYIIENVNTVYYSKEYLEEVAYNSQANIFFGYTLEELDDKFQGTSYVFTVNDDGETVVKALEGYDDTYEQVIKNIAIGSGIILVCVTVSVATGGAGAAPISMIFAASAKTGTAMALGSGVFSGVAAGVVKGIQTKDVEESVKAAALAGSESFKWGAITGVLSGGTTEYISIKNTAKALGDATEVAKGTVDIADDLPQWRQAELRALNESGGCEQLTYLDGKLVGYGTSGATRPDIVVNHVDYIEAVEVKYYNLENSACLKTLYDELKREVSARVVNLPKGSVQKIILDVTERGYSAETVAQVQSTIWEVLADIYPNIPIEIVGLL